MARITVEDCLDNVDNRFQLVLVASKRARQLSLGSEPLLEQGKDKPTVLALREIAEGYITRDILTEAPEDDLADILGDMDDDIDAEALVDEELAALIGVGMTLETPQVEAKEEQKADAVDSKPAEENISE